MAADTPVVLIVGGAGYGKTTLLESIHEGAEKIPQRALVILISDLFVPPTYIALSLPQAIRKTPERNPLLKSKEAP